MLEIKNLHISHLAASLVNLNLQEGEIVGLVGPSGSGKSTIAGAIMGLLPGQGEILLNGENLLLKTPLEMERKRGKEIALINQNVMTALHPLLTIGTQISETIRHHKKVPQSLAKKQTIALLERVSLKASHYHSYPHELSGGMRQRVMIAMAISCGPSLLIADEPTTALDVTIQAQIIALLKSLKVSTLFITHDLALVAGLCDRVYVMHEGQIVESGTTTEVFENPRHPITQTLLSSKKTQLTKPPKEAPVIQVRGLSKKYNETLVVNPTSLSLIPGETVGLIGESGCGKSTLGKMIAGLLPPTSGEILAKPKPQMIFQDPYGSLNPRMRVQEIIREGLEIHHIPNQKERTEELLTQVQLPLHYLTRYPHQLSGGEKQRVGIARALSVNPKVLICDEPLSSLDTVTQKHIIDLFLDLQRKLCLSYLFISHDLNALRQFAHRILVMYQGQIVEEGNTEELFKNPQHPYTQLLLGASLK